MMPKFVRALALMPLSPLVVALLLQGSAAAQETALATPLKRSEYLVFSQCKPGLKEQCDRWYAKHLKDITRIEGMMSAQEYAVVPGRGGMSKDKDRLIVYQIDGDPQVVLARLRPAVNEGRLESPDPALFEMPFQSAIVEKVGAEVKAGR